MEKKPYGTFRLGRRGRRGRRRYDHRWNVELGARSCFQNGNLSTVQTPSAGNNVLVNWDVTAGPAQELRTSSPSPDEAVDMTEDIVQVREAVDMTGDAVQGQEVEDMTEDAVQVQEAVDMTEDAVQVQRYETNCVEGMRTDVINLEEPLPEHMDLDLLSTAEQIAREDEDEDLTSVETGTVVPARVRSTWKKVCSWQNLLAFLMLNGTGRLSVEQYDAVRLVINLFMGLGVPTETQLPAPSTVRKKIQPLLQRWGFAASEWRTATMIGDTASVAPPCNSNTLSDAEKARSFIVVVPSAWSLMDVTFKPTWNILKASASEAPSSAVQPVFSTIHSVPMVADKKRILDVAHAILPTCLTHTKHKTPILLSERFHIPVIVLTFKSTPSFPAEVIAGMDADVHDDVLRIRTGCVRSVIVRPTREQEHRNRHPHIVNREFLLSGNFSALHTPTFDLWRAGDVCTLLTVPLDVKYISVVVRQHVRRLGQPQGMELICIPVIHDADDEVECVIAFDKVHRATLSNITNDATQSMSRELPRYGRAPTFGRLQDGRLFFVDHILLYSDGFSQYNFKQGSAGGVYALSLNYPVSLRRSRERVRVVALTPPGVSTMEGLRAIIDDIVKSSTEGVQVRNADGEEMLLFTNVVGYVADYHETGHALDVTGQSGKAPCHLCAFLRYTGHPSTASRYAYSTVIHSSDTNYARMGTRTQAVRASSVSNNEFIEIGLNPPEEATQKNSPLHELSSKLREAVRRTEIPLTVQNSTVVNPQFDPYRSVLVSPDHVLFGVACNALNFAFSMLPSKSRRQQVDRMISESLRHNGLPKETQIFNLKTSTLHAASISTRFCTLLVSSEIFKEVVDNCRQCGEGPYSRTSPALLSIDNLKMLRNLVAATYWFPNISVDSQQSVTDFNFNGGQAHLRKIEVMCEEYVTNVNSLCKRFPEAREELDKPNVHRVLELYKHSIPAMGHVQHFAELVFETAHQPLKRAMLRSNFRNSHLQSSESCIADDWKRRVQCVMNNHMCDVQSESDSDGETELLKLLCCRREEAITGISSNQELRRHASVVLRSSPIRAILNTKPSNLNENKWVSTWVLSKPYEIPKENDDRTLNYALISQLAEDLLVDGFKEMKLFSRAAGVRLLPAGRHIQTSKPRRHEILHRNTVLQARIEDEQAPFLMSAHCNNEEETSLTYFAVETLVSFSEKPEDHHQSGRRSYAAVRKCEPTTTDLLQIAASSPLQLLLLTDDIRRVDIVHACQNDSTLNCFSSSMKAYECNASILRGHQFYYYSRERGYPPRMA